MDVGGNMDVESVQSTSNSQTEAISGHLQVGVYGPAAGKVSGGINASLSESDRAWVDDQTELTGGNSVNINVGGNLHNKGAVIANVDSDGKDGGNLQVAVGGDLTYENIYDKDKSTTRGIGYSYGIDTSKSNSVGGSTGSVTYNDSKTEGITRATIGEGTITVGGVASDGEGINRDISKAQETTFNEGMEVTVNVPLALITNPKKYITETVTNIKEFNKNLAKDVEAGVNNLKKILPADMQYQADAFVKASNELLNNENISPQQKALIVSDKRFQELVATAAALSKILNGRDISQLSDDELAQISMEAGFRLEFADNGDGTSVLRAYYNRAVQSAGAAILDSAADGARFLLEQAQNNPEEFILTLATLQSLGSMPLEAARISIYESQGADALREFDAQMAQIQSATGELQADAINNIKSWAIEHGFTKEEAALYAAAVGVGVVIGTGVLKVGSLSEKDPAAVIKALEEFAEADEALPETPIGRKGNPINVKPGTNTPTTIAGRNYSGHALDQMQGRGIPSSVVEDTIQNGVPISGNSPGTTEYISSTNGISVVVNSSGGVITVITKKGL